MNEMIDPQDIITHTVFGDVDYGPDAGIDVTVRHDGMDLDTLAQRTYRYYAYNYQDPFFDHDLLSINETEAVVRIFSR